MKVLKFSQNYINDVLETYKYNLYVVDKNLYVLVGYNNLTKLYFVESQFDNIESAEDYIMDEVAT